MGIMKYSRLGDTFFEDKAKKINQALEKINAPYYQVCKKVRGSKANKDAFDISWRKRNITCDIDYPNATTTGEKVVMRQLEKHFGISLSLLNSDTPRAIKKSLDYQKAQQTILDNKIKARQERERAAAERKALRNAPKTKTTTKTTTTKSIPPSERNDNKAVASKNNEVFTEVDGNITYFYTETKNNRRRNHAKLNIATNRITYLNSAVPMYVKEFIKGYKSVNILNKKMISKMQESKSSPAKSTKAVEEKKETVPNYTKDNKSFELYTVIKSIKDKALDENIQLMVLKQETNFITLKVYNDEYYLGEMRLSKDRGKEEDKFILRAYLNGEDTPFSTLETSYSTFKISSNVATRLRNIFNEYNKEFGKRKREDAKPTPKEVKKEVKVKKIEVTPKEAQEIVLEEIKYYLENKGYSVNRPIKTEPSFDIATKIGIYIANINVITYSNGNLIIEFRYFADPKYNFNIKTEFNNFVDSGSYKIGMEDIVKVLDIAKHIYSQKPKEEIKEEYIKEIPKYATIKATDFARKMGIEVNEMKPMNEPETTEVKVFPKVALKSKDQLIKATKELIKLWVLQNKPSLFNKLAYYERYNNEGSGSTTIDLRLGINNDYYHLEFREKYDEDDRKTYFSVVYTGKNFVSFKKGSLMSDIGEELKEFIDKWLNKVINNISMDNEEDDEPETTEIIKETPPIMIDEDEAAKFDKGLDELTKLLQQAMQG